jgi:plasmid stability protein
MATLPFHVIFEQGARSRAALAHVIHMCNPPSMAKMIQVRNVPDALHRELMKRARARGETLTQYVQSILEREVARPPAEDVFERIRSREPVPLDRPAADLIREERTRREGS